MSFHKWINKQIEENYYTPDLPDIYRSESHYMFLADNLQQGKARHKFLSEQEDYDYIGKAFTKSATYGIMMLQSPIEPINPLYFEVVPNREAAFIYGELYEVSPDVLIDLDYHQGNNLMTKRQKIKVVTRHRNAEVDAWTYLADVDYFTEPRMADRLKQYVPREYLWNVPVIAWDNSIFR